MIRDPFFSAPRFVNLCRKEMVESWKANLLRFVMMYGIMAIAFVWNGYFRYKYPQGMINGGVEQDPIWYFELTIFLWAIVIMGLLSASFVMERMKTKTNRIAVLMTPATMFEKFLSRWLVFTFGFLIVFLIAFKLADWTRVMIYMVSYPELKGVIASAPLSYLGNSGYYWTGLQTWDGLLMALSGYFFAQSIFILGSSIWPRNSFVKTFSAVIVIIIVYVAIGSVLAKILFEGRGGHGVHQTMSDEAMMHLSTVVFFVMAIFNWVVAYFRFKESEIINLVSMNFKESKAIYLQIADRICDEVLLGQYREEERIPSVREYAAVVEVNANTVMRSYDYLQSQEVIYNKRGIGYFVASGARALILSLRKEYFLKEEVDYFFKQMYTLGISAEDMSAMYREFSKKQK